MMRIIWFRADNFLDIIFRFAVAHDQIIILRLLSFLFQIIDGPNNFHLTTLLAIPDGQRRAPITLAGYGPVFDLTQPLAESSLFDMLRFPINSLISFDQLISQFRHRNIPGIPGKIYKWSLATPAMRITVFIFFLFIKQTAVGQIFNNIDGHFFIPHKSRRQKTSFLSKGTIIVDEVIFWQTYLSSQIKV